MATAFPQAATERPNETPLRGDQDSFDENESSNLSSSTAPVHPALIMEIACTFQ